MHCHTRPPSLRESTEVPTPLHDLSGGSIFEELWIVSAVVLSHGVPALLWNGIVTLLNVFILSVAVCRLVALEVSKQHLSTWLFR
jgi:hypothetical protein